MSDSFVADVISWFETLEEWIPGAGNMARDLIVGRMPEADQEAVYQLAEAWGDAAVRLGNAYQDVAQSAEEIIQNWTGDGAAMQFADQWFDFLEAMRSTADSLGSLQMGVNSYGLQVELQKFMVALNLILLGATLLMIIAAMLPSGGTSAGGIIPAFMAASRLIYLAASATIRAIASISIRALLRGLAVFLVRIVPTLVRTVPTLVRTTVPTLVRTTAPTLVRTTLPNAVRTALPIVGRGAASVGRSFLPSNLARGLLPRNVIARALANRMAAQATRGLVTRAMLRAVAGQTGAAGARALGWRATLAVQNQLARTIERQLLERFGTRIGTAAVERSLSAGAARLSGSAINQAATRAALTGLAREIGEVSLGRELARYIGYRVAAGAAIMGGGNLAGQFWQISTGHRAAGDISWEQAGIATFQGAALGAGMWGSPLGHMLGGAVTGGVAAAGVSAYTHAVHDLDGLGADDWSSIWAEAQAGAVHGAVAGAVFGTLAHVQSTAMHLPLKIGHDVQVVQGERGLGIIASDRTSGVEMWTARGKGAAYFRLEGGPIDQGGRLAERGLVDPEGNVVFHETFNPVRPQLETTIVDAPGPGRPALPPGDVPASQGPPGVARPDILRPEVIGPEVVRPEVVRPEVVRPEVVRPEVVRPEVVRGGEGSPDRPALPPGDPAKVPLDLPRGEAARLEAGLTRAAERPLSELTHRDIDQILRHPERHEPSLVRHVEQHFARQISDGTYRPLPDADVRLQAERLDATVRQHLSEQHEELTQQRARWEAERSQNPAGMELFERFEPPPPEPPRPVRQPDAFSGRQAWRAWGEHQAWQSERAAWEAGVERTAREVYAERASPRLASEVDSLLSLRRSDGSRVPMTQADLVRVLDRLYEARAQGDAALRETYARLRDEAAIGGEYIRPEAPARPTGPGSPPVEPVEPVQPVDTGARPRGGHRLSTVDNKAAGRHPEPFDLEQLRAGYRDSGRPAVAGHGRDLYIGRPLRTETPADPVGLAAAIDQALPRVPAPSGESVRGVSSPWRATEIQPVGDGLVAVRFRDGSTVEVRIGAGRLDSGARMRIEYPDLRFDEAGRGRPAEPVRIVIDERVGADRPASRPVETAIGLRQGLNEVHKWLTSAPDGSVGPGEAAGRPAAEVPPPGETVKPSHTVEVPEAAPARDGGGTVAAERGSGADEAVGARVRPVDHIRAMAWAAEAYERFRATDADIADIVGNLAAAARPSGKIGFAPAEIAQIKRHVLHEEHLLDDYEGGYVRKRFAPDEDMAEAWIRLRSGRHLYADLVLLEHELAESNYLRANPGATYRQAHNHANESYNWEAMIPGRTGEDLDVLWAGERSDGSTGGFPEGAGGPTGGRVRFRGGEDGPATRDPQGVSGGHPPRREQGQELHQDPLADSGLLSERSTLAGEGFVRSVDRPAAPRFAERADTSFLDALLNPSTRGGELVPVDRPGASARAGPAEPSLLDARVMPGEKGRADVATPPERPGVGPTNDWTTYRIPDGDVAHRVDEAIRGARSWPAPVDSVTPIRPGFWQVTFINGQQIPVEIADQPAIVSDAVSYALPERSLRDALSGRLSEPVVISVGSRYADPDPTAVDRAIQARVGHALAQAYARIAPAPVEDRGAVSMTTDRPLAHRLARGPARVGQAIEDYLAQLGVQGPEGPVLGYTPTGPTEGVATLRNGGRIPIRVAAGNLPEGTLATARVTESRSDDGTVGWVADIVVSDGITAVGSRTLSTQAQGVLAAQLWSLYGWLDQMGRSAVPTPPAPGPTPPAPGPTPPRVPAPRPVPPPAPAPRPAPARPEVRAPARATEEVDVATAVRTAVAGWRRSPAAQAPPTSWLAATEPNPDGSTTVWFRDGSSVAVRIAPGRLADGTDARITYPELRFDRTGAGHPAGPVELVVSDRMGRREPQHREDLVRLRLSELLDQVHDWLTVPPEPLRRTLEPVAGAKIPFRMVPVPAIPVGGTVERPEAVRDVFETHLDDLVRGRRAEAPDQPFRATWDPDANTLTVHYPDGPSVWVVPQVNSVLPAGRPVVVRPNLVGAAGRWVQAGPAVVVLPAHTSADPAEHRDLVERHLADAWRTLYSELRGILPPGPPLSERPTPDGRPAEHVAAEQVADEQVADERVADEPARREDTHVEEPVAEPAHEQRASALPAEPEIPVLGPDRVRFRDVSPAAPPAPQPLTPEWVAEALADRMFPARSVRWIQEHLAVRGDDGSYVPKSLAEIEATVARLRDEAVQAVTRPAPSTPSAPGPLQPPASGPFQPPASAPFQPPVPVRDEPAYVAVTPASGGLHPLPPPAYGHRAGASYLDDAQLAEARLTLAAHPTAPERVVVLDSAGRRFDSRRFAPDGVVLWGMDVAGRLYAVAPDGFAHTGIGLPLAGAGRIAVLDGEIAYLDGDSPVFEAPGEYLRQVVDVLERAGLDLTHTVVYPAVRVPQDPYGTAQRALDAAVDAVAIRLDTPLVSGIESLPGYRVRLDRPGQPRVEVDMSALAPMLAARLPAGELPAALAGWLDTKLGQAIAAERPAGSREAVPPGGAPEFRDAVRRAASQVATDWTVAAGGEHVAVVRPGRGQPIAFRVVPGALAEGVVTATAPRSRPIELAGAAAVEVVVPAAVLTQPIKRDLLVGRALRAHAAEIVQARAGLTRLVTRLVRGRPRPDALGPHGTAFALSLADEQQVAQLRVLVDAFREAAPGQRAVIGREILALDAAMFKRPGQSGSFTQYNLVDEHIPGVRDLIDGLRRSYPPPLAGDRPLDLVGRLAGPEPTREPSRTPLPAPSIPDLTVPVEVGAGGTAWVAHLPDDLVRRAGERDSHAVDALIRSVEGLLRAAADPARWRDGRSPRVELHVRQGIDALLARRLEHVRVDAAVEASGHVSRPRATVTGSRTFGYLPELRLPAAIVEQDVRDRVPYLQGQARERLRVQWRDGLAYDADGVPLNGLYDFSIEPGTLAVYARSHEVGGLGNLKHSSFLAGADVLAPGEFLASNGRIRWGDNRSGHYLPTTEHLWILWEVLAANGADIAGLDLLEVGAERTPYSRGRGERSFAEALAEIAAPGEIPGVLRIDRIPGSPDARRDADAVPGAVLRVTTVDGWTVDVDASNVHNYLTAARPAGTDAARFDADRRVFIEDAQLAWQAADWLRAQVERALTTPPVPVRPAPREAPRSPLLADLDELLAALAGAPGSPPPVARMPEALAAVRAVSAERIDAEAAAAGLDRAVVGALKARLAGTLARHDAPPDPDMRQRLADSVVSWLAPDQPAQIAYQILQEEVQRLRAGVTVLEAARIADEAIAERARTPNIQRYERLLAGWLATPEGQAHHDGMVGLDLAVQVPRALPADSARFVEIAPADAGRVHAEQGGDWAPAVLAALGRYSAAGGGWAVDDLVTGGGGRSRDARADALRIQSAMRPSGRDALLHARVPVRALGVASVAELPRLLGGVAAHQTFLRAWMGSGPHRADEIHLEIETPAGTRLAWLGRVRGVDGSGEAELLLAAGTRLAVLGLTRRHYGSYTLRVRVAGQQAPEILATPMLGGEAVDWSDEVMLRREGDGPTGAEDGGPRIPMTMDSVRRIAHRYDIDVAGLRFVLRKDRTGYYGSTGPDQTVTLTRDAFRDEVQLARTLAHERYHVDQIRGGMGYPRTDAEAVVWERDAHAYERRWWDRHPLNPANAGSPDAIAPSFEAFWRELSDRIDRQARARGTSPEAELQQFAIQRVLARVFAANPDDWMLKGGQSMLARFPGARESSDIDLVRISGGDRDVMAADYTAALGRDLRDHLRFVLESRTDLANVPGVRLEHGVFLGDRRVMTLSADLVPPRPLWRDPDTVPFPAHRLETGVAGEHPDLRVISLHDVLAAKISAMYTYTATGGLPERSQDLPDLLVLALNTAWDGPATHAMVHEEISWRLARGEPVRVPDHFAVPNPTWGPQFARYAAATPGLPYMNLADALPLATAFLDPLLGPTAPDADWDPRALRWVPRSGQPARAALPALPAQPALPAVLELHGRGVLDADGSVVDPAAVRLIEATGDGRPSTVFADQTASDRWDRLSGGPGEPGSLEAQIAALEARTDLSLPEKVRQVREHVLPGAGVEPSPVRDLDSKNLRFYAHQSGELFIHSVALKLNPDTTIDVAYHLDHTLRAFSREARASQLAYLDGIPEGMTAEQADAVALWRAHKGLPLTGVDPAELAGDLIDISVQPLRDALTMRQRLIHDYGVEAHRIRVAYGGLHESDARYGESRWQRAHMLALSRLRDDPVEARRALVDTIRGSGAAARVHDARAAAVAERLYGRHEPTGSAAAYALLWVRDSRAAPAANRNGLDTQSGVLRQTIDLLRRYHPDRRIVLVGDDLFARRPELRTAWERDGTLDDVDTGSLVRFWAPARNAGTALRPAEQALFFHKLITERDIIQIGTESGALEIPFLLGAPTVYLENMVYHLNKGNRWAHIWQEWRYGRFELVRDEQGGVRFDAAGQPVRRFRGRGEPLPAPLSTVRRVQFGPDLPNPKTRQGPIVMDFPPQLVALTADRLVRLVDGAGLDRWPARLGHTDQGGGAPRLAWDEQTWATSRYYADQLLRWLHSTAATPAAVGRKWDAIRLALKGVLEPDFTVDPEYAGLAIAHPYSLLHSDHPVPRDAAERIARAYEAGADQRGPAVARALAGVLGDAGLRQRSVDDLSVFRLEPAAVRDLRQAMDQVLAAARGQHAVERRDGRVPVPAAGTPRPGGGLERAAPRAVVEAAERIDASTTRLIMAAIGLRIGTDLRNRVGDPDYYLVLADPADPSAGGRVQPAGDFAADDVSAAADRLVSMDDPAVEPILRQTAVRELAETWARPGRHGAESVRAIAAMEVARTRFGLPDVPARSLDPVLRKKVAIEREYNEYVVGEALSAQYEITQRELSRGDLPELTLYRYLPRGDPVAVGTVLDLLPGQALEGWTSNRDAARHDATAGRGVVVAATIPAGMIFAMPGTALTGPRPDRFVVLGHRVTATVEAVVRGSTGRAPDPARPSADGVTGRGTEAPALDAPPGPPPMPYEPRHNLGGQRWRREVDGLLVAGAGGDYPRWWPRDQSGYAIQGRDLAYLGISRQQFEWFLRREAPLGMTPDQFGRFRLELLQALRRDGIAPAEVDVRLKGSGARLYSGRHKELPTEADLADDPAARAALRRWLGDDPYRPRGIPFDALFRLGLSDERSDYDLDISSTAMVALARSRVPGPLHPDDFLAGHGYLDERAVRNAFPHLVGWRRAWGRRLSRSISTGVFESSGSFDRSAFFIVSEHFRDEDWKLLVPGRP